MSGTTAQNTAYNREWRRRRREGWVAQHKTLEERFWEKVDKRGPDECWPWLGWHNRTGYGLINEKQRSASATHVALRLAGRPLLTGQMALHHCDNPPCVNPAHLFAGTALDNITDAMHKGRLRPASKLTTEQVVAIRTRHSTGETQRQLAREYGVDQTAISQLVRRKTWRHVA